jgi:hypothetical protein
MYEAMPLTKTVWMLLLLSAIKWARAGARREQANAGERYHGQGINKVLGQHLLNQEFVKDTSMTIRAAARQQVRKRHDGFRLQAM